MKVKSSEYLKAVKPVLKKLLDKLLSQYPYASILAVDSTAADYQVTKSLTNMSEDDLWCSRGFVAKVYDGETYAEYSFNEILEEKIDEIAAAIAATEKKLKTSAGDMPFSRYKALEDEPCVFCESTEYELSLIHI